MCRGTLAALTLSRWFQRYFKVTFVSYINAWWCLFSIGAGVLLNFNTSPSFCFARFDPEGSDAAVMTSVSSRDYSPVRQVGQVLAWIQLTGLRDGQVMESSIIFVPHWLAPPAFPLRHKCVPSLQGLPFFLPWWHKRRCNMRERQRHRLVFSPSVAAAAATLMLFSFTRTVGLLWAIPAPVFFIFNSF